jgi:response regulator NasT
MYPEKMTQSLKIAVVEKDRERALTIVDGLHAAGSFEVRIFGDETGLARKIAEMEPDLVLIDTSDPTRDALEDMTLASQPQERPVAVFVDRSDDATMRAAIEAGVSAYVVDGLSAEKIKSVLEIAIARFNSFSRLRNELAATKLALEERKVLDRAKGLLMKAKNIPEDEAYTILRKAAMDQGRKLVDVARDLIAAVDLLK